MGHAAETKLASCVKQHSRDKCQWETVQEQLAAAKQAEISEFETSALSLQSELGELREGMKANAASMFSTAVDASVHSDAKISELEAVLCDMNELCAARQSKVEELEPKLQASETLAVSLQGDLDELRESLKANAASMLSTAIDESVVSYNTFEEVEKQLACANEMILAKEARVQALEAELVSVIQTAAATKLELSELQVQSTRAALEHERQRTHYEVELQSMDADIGQLDNELVSVCKTAATTQAELSELQVQSARAALEHELKSTKYKAALEGAKEDLAQLQARTKLDKAHTMASATESQTTIGKLEKELLDANTATIAKLEQMEKELADEKDTVIASQTTVEGLKLELTGAADRAAVAEAEIVALEIRLADGAESAVVAQAMIEELGADVHHWQATAARQQIKLEAVTHWAS